VLRHNKGAFQEIPLSKINDLVPCLYPGSPREGDPDFTAERGVVRAWKKEGKGYFIAHGRIFQLIAAVVDNFKELLGKGNIVPFSRIQKRVGDLHLRPERISYPIPALGDHRLRWRRAFMAQGF
jgi:hypothetical protein